MLKALTTRNAAKMMSAALCLVMALASLGMAMPMASHAEHCKSMAPQAKTGHDCCPRKVEVKPACPRNRDAMAMQLALMPACCQLADERLPVPRETAAPGTQVQNETSVAHIAAAFHTSRRNLQSGWLEGGLRYSRPVFEAKADLLI